MPGRAGITGALLAGCLATTAHAQSENWDVACATTNIASEKAICAWEAYRDERGAMFRRINRALLMLEAFGAGSDANEPNEARDRLIASQQAWEIFREETCLLEASFYVTGDGSSLAYATCLKRLTEERNRDLKVILQEN